MFSCLCVTEARPAFRDWLLWNYDKQDLASRELVVVDSSPEPWQLPCRDDVVVVRCPPGTGVARKRNLAVEAARGDLLTWFDDDDWQHPAKLSILARAAFERGRAFAGPARSWFVDLERGRAREVRVRRNALFNGVGVRRDVATAVRFDETRARAADSGWLTAMQHRAGPPLTIGDVLFFWLSHGDNVSNPSRRYVFRQPLDVVRAAIGAAAWADTDERLDALRGRLSAG